MRAPALLFCLMLTAALPAAAWAQSEADTQHLSAEEFLNLDNPAPKKAAPDAAAKADTPSKTDASAPAATGDASAAPSPFDEDDQHKRQMEDRSIVRLRTIDKLSARTHTFDIPVGKTVKFGKALFIKARACRTASPLDEPENAAFLQIWERLPATTEGAAETSRWIFSGWMFSSSPSLSAMEHPIYDVWLIDCRNDATVAASETYSAESAPAATVDDAAEAKAAEDAKEDDKAAKDGAKDDKSGKDSAAAKDGPKDGKDKPAPETPAANAAAASEPAATPEQMAPVEPVAGGTAAVPTLQELPGSFEDGDDDQ